MLRYSSTIISVFLTCITLLSCNNGGSGQEAPEELIEEKKMIDILVATHILEQQVSESKFAKVVKEDSFRVYRDEIFNEHGIDSASFFASYNYYTNQVDQFYQMMTAVTDSLGYLRDHSQDNPTKQEDKETVNKEGNSIKNEE